MQQGFVEINAFEKQAGVVVDIHYFKEVKQDQAQRHEYGDQHDANGGRQLDKTIIEITENSRQGDKQGRDIYGFHFSAFFIFIFILPAIVSFRDSFFKIFWKGIPPIFCKNIS